LVEKASNLLKLTVCQHGQGGERERGEPVRTFSEKREGLLFLHVLFVKLELLLSKKIVGD